MPQNMAKVTFYQLLKTSDFSVKCYLNSVKKHLKSDDPDQEHNSPPTFTYIVVVDISGLHQLLAQKTEFLNGSVGNPTSIPCFCFIEDFFPAGSLTPTLVELVFFSVELVL